MERSELLRRARGAFERGRLAKAARTSALVLPVTLVSFGCCGDRAASLGIAAALATLVFVLVWRGGAAGRGVVPGLVAGVVSLAIPLLVCPACAHAGGVAILPLVACIVGGVVSGAIVVGYATHEHEDRASFVVAAGAVAALAGSLGCVIVGLGGIVAMALGVALVAPLALRVPRSS
jgi:hypothetical protein